MHKETYSTFEMRLYLISLKNLEEHIRYRLAAEQALAR